MSSRVTVAIPTYNRPEYLKECIQSVLNQTLQDFSIFVFDNASDKPIEQELKNFHDERIHFLSNEKNIGSTGNINRILNYSFQSEYIVIFHDDDVMHPEKLELQTAFLDTHKDVVFVASDFQSATEKNINVFPTLAKENTRPIVYKTSSDFVKAEMSWLRCAFGSVMYRKESMGDSRMEPEKFSDFADMAFLAKVSQRGSSAFIPVPLMNYRTHLGQDSKVRKEEYLRGAIELLSLFRKILPAVFDKADEKLFRKYSLNFLLQSYAYTDNGFLGLLQFMKKYGQQNLVRKRDVRYIDIRGIVSILSIILKNKKIISLAQWLKN